MGFGSPRVGNLKLAEAITASYLAEGVGTIGIAYMRDPVPHVPPRILGYRSAQALLFHIAIDPMAAVKAEMGDPFNIADYILYSATYISNSNNGWKGDKDFAGSTYTFQMNDHMGYFLS